MFKAFVSNSVLSIITLMLIGLVAGLVWFRVTLMRKLANETFLRSFFGMNTPSIGGTLAANSFNVIYVMLFRPITLFIIQKLLEWRNFKHEVQYEGP
jgi:hypothetical protein